MGQAQINVRTRACSRTSIARTKQAALTHNVRGKELIVNLCFKSGPKSCILVLPFCKHQEQNRDCTNIIELYFAQMGHIQVRK